MCRHNHYHSNEGDSLGSGLPECLADCSPALQSLPADGPIHPWPEELDLHQQPHVGLRQARPLHSPLPVGLHHSRRVEVRRSAIHQRGQALAWPTLWCRPQSAVPTPLGNRYLTGWRVSKTLKTSHTDSNWGPDNFPGGTVTRFSGMTVSQGEVGKVSPGRGGGVALWGGRKKPLHTGMKWSAPVPPGSSVG